MAGWVREDWMRRAIELSRRGFPAPNPHVGCVLEKDGVLVGEGFHEYAGGPHAEAAALAVAGDAARGATAYVTLEPCNHHGRTPPCSQALIDAGVARVAIACHDPNPRAMGGSARLRAAGIEVAEGFLCDEAKAANQQFHTALRLGRPYVVAKAAISLDGRIALASGESQWITGPEARQEGHRLRAELGAVLVGRGTVQADDPALTARIDGVRNQPLRVVLDPRNRLTGAERLFLEDAPLLHLVGEARAVRQKALPTRSGLFDPAEILAAIWEEGQTGVLIEGGPITLGHFLRARLVDRLELFVAPRVLGDGRAWLQGLGLASLDESPWFELLAPRMVGRDLWISAVPTSNPGP